MRTPTRWITSPLLAVSLLLSACGPATTPQSPATQAPVATVAPEATQPPASEPTTAPEPAEEITLTWLILEFWNPDQTIAAYQAAHPNVTIQVEKVGFADLFQQNQIRLGAGDGSPDIVSVDVPLVASYGARGWLYPLDAAFTTEDKQAWVSGALEAGSYDGQLLAAPQHTSTQLLYYNKGLLEAAGITPPGEDERWTWEQLAEAAKQLTHDDVYGFTWEQTTAAYQLLPLPQSLGGKAIGDDGFTVEGVVNSPEWIKAFTFYGNAFNAHGYAPKGDTPAADMFKAGQLAMFVGGEWNNLVFSWGPPEFEWGVSRMPYFEGGEIVTPTGSWHFGINAKSAHAPEAYVYPFSLKAFIPQAFTLSAYQTLFFEKGFGTAIFNTSLLTIGTVLIGGLINLLAGFAFGVFDFRGKNLLFGIVLFTFMVPIEVTIIPQYIQMRDLGWINTWQGLLVPGLANSLVIFLFRQFFAEFPRDLLDAARVDGASWGRILFSLVLPVSRPVLVGAGLVLFLSAWNAFFWPLVVAPRPEFRVIQVAISLSAQQVQTLFNEMFAGALIAAVVPIVLLLPLQRYYVNSIAATGIKE